jgi:hypothetical protein
VGSAGSEASALSFMAPAPYRFVRGRGGDLHPLAIGRAGRGIFPGNIPPRGMQRVGGGFDRP